MRCSTSTPTVDGIRSPAAETAPTSVATAVGCRFPGTPTPRRSASRRPDRAAEPWLPQPPSYVPLAVDAQEDDPRSTLTLYRRALALRRERVVGAPRSGRVARSAGPPGRRRIPPWRARRRDKLRCGAVRAPPCRGDTVLLRSDGEKSPVLEGSSTVWLEGPGASSRGSLRERHSVGPRLAARIGRARDRRAGEAGPARRGGAEARPRGSSRVPSCARLLAGQQAGRRVRRRRRTGSGRGAHWRLVSLRRARASRPASRTVLAAAETVLAWLTEQGPSRPHPGRSTGSRAGAGRRRATRWRSCCRLGLADDRARPRCSRAVAGRVAVARRRLELRRAGRRGYRSSFNESLAPDVGPARVLGSDR